MLDAERILVAGGKWSRMPWLSSEGLGDGTLDATEPLGFRPELSVVCLSVKRLSPDGDTAGNLKLWDNEPDAFLPRLAPGVFGALVMSRFRRMYWFGGVMLICDSAVAGIAVWNGE